MTNSIFTSDETRNTTEYILECVKAILHNNPYDTEYQVEVNITTDYGYRFHTVIEFLRGDKNFFNGREYICEEYIKINSIPVHNATYNNREINTLQFRKSDIERYISDWLNA